jgi:RNA polymerase sigma-70 factor (ECF subfamily)
MPQDHSFDDLMARLRSGDDDAATQVFQRFADQLIALAQKRLSPKMRRKVDAEDVLQSVFRSFFARQAAGQMGPLANWDNLWGMLMVITLRKCGRRIDYFHSACRDIDRETPNQKPADRSGEDWQTSGNEPTPAEAAQLTDMVEHLLNHFDGKHRDIVALSLQGCTAPEISSQLACTERMVYRVLERVKEWVARQQDDLPNGP